MTDEPDHISLQNSIVTRIPWYRVLINTMTDRFTYNPFRNGFLWIGFFWGLPIPILFFQVHNHIHPDELSFLASDPVHLFFLSHPLLFALAFGIAGSVIRYYVRRLHNESIRDYLTGIYNHRFFRTELDRRINEADRYDAHFSLILFDIDDFKGINDRYGHQTGDDVLKTVANLFNEFSRTSDMVFRYGGEEFVILLPETSLDEALNLAERIRKRVAEHDFGIDRPVTISGGVAEYPGISTDGSDLIQNVDELLYRAKEQGRNQIVSRKDRSVNVEDTEVMDLYSTDPPSCSTVP